MYNKINDNTLFEVWNNHRSSVGYIIGGVSNVWHTPGLMKKVKMDEVRNAFNQIGGRKLITQGALLIKDSNVRAELGLPELDEYLLDRDQMKDLLINGDLNNIEDFLQYCSNMLLTTFTQIAIELPIQDMNIARLITKYAGTDVLNVIEERAADEELVKDIQPTQTVDSTGRAKRIAKE